VAMVRDQLQVDPATLETLEPPIESPHQPVHFAVTAGCIAAVGPNLAGHAVARACRHLADEIFGGSVMLCLMKPCAGVRFDDAACANELGRYL